MDNLTTQNTTITNTNNRSKLHSLFSQNLLKKPLLSSVSWFPTSALVLLLTFLLAYSSFSTLYFNFNPLLSIDKNIKETQETLLEPFNFTSLQNSSISTPLEPKWVTGIPPSKAPLGLFAQRVSEFLLNKSCKVRFFMTWLSPLESFGERQRFTIESLFKSNPNGCLLIVSESMDSEEGAQILSPFLRLGFRVMAISPNYGFILNNTMGAAWFDQLKRGEVDPGEVLLGQNLSNLLRLCLLYKYGGVYMDTDFIVLKRLDKLRNSIGAQNVDPKTRNWTRLNNAFMVFDKKHPLLTKFIEEYALNFNGHKWGYNGPYLVSRVVERLRGSNIDVGINFTILPPTAFYPVGWEKIGGLFQSPKDEGHLKWAKSKLNQIEGESYALHLWNRQSKGIMVEEGSIVSHLMEQSCIFCDSSTKI